MEQEPQIRMEARFVVKVAKDGQFYFSFLSPEGRKILGSEMYKAKASAFNGIASIKRNAPDSKRYDRLVARNGKLYFTLEAGNHEIIGMSDFYETEELREQAVATVMWCAPDAEVFEEIQAAPAHVPPPPATVSMGSGVSATAAAAAPARIRTKAEVTKTIEARKLNPRTLRPMPNEEPVVIRFGSILQKVKEEDRRLLFEHLGQTYETDLARAQGSYRMID
jgi:uncharacterized protein YegP (UPF0339 family)